MGDLRFKYPNVSGMDPRVWSTAYITGIEGIPWHCHHRASEDQFSIGREIDESGKLNIVWPTRGLGNVCLSTTSLRVSPQEYTLAVELARGTISRLKNQTSEWQRVGLKLPDGFFPLAEQALSEFLHALTTDKESEQLAGAQAAIDSAIEASVLLCSAFATQALESRRLAEGRLSTLLGVKLHKQTDLAKFGGELDRAFNLVEISPDLGTVELSSGKKDFSAFDAQMEWATEHHKKICVGPLVNFHAGNLPRWMVLLDQGIEGVMDTACAHAKSVVERYVGRTHIWNCASGLNLPTELGWTDEEVLRMAVSIIETVRNADERSPVLLTIDQPWSEYLRDDANGISPLHFADALIRADLGLSGLALELNFDVWPNGSFPRDPIDISRMIDRWSMLGLPLLMVVTSPTNVHADPSGSRVSQWKTGRSPGIMPADTILRLLLSKPSVHAVIWQQISDEGAGANSGAGLWDAQGAPKPILDQVTHLRKTYMH